MQSKRFLDKDLQRVVTDYNSLSATSDLKMADYDIPVYPGTMRYNPQVKDHGIIIGCLIFHGLLMMRSESVFDSGRKRFLDHFDH